MNENISQEINLALMKQVERAVRPIPAGRKRKLQMHEELLAHLTAIYQEELQRNADEPVARLVWAWTTAGQNLLKNTPIES